VSIKISFIFFCFKNLTIKSTTLILEIHKKIHNFGSEGRIRTADPRLMSPGQRPLPFTS